MEDIYPKILCGWVVSPAGMREQNREKEVSTCCIACGELGTFEHVYWECEHIHKLLGGRPVVTDPIQKRYGWPKGDNREEDLEVLQWMKKVTQTIWDQRYNEAAKKEAKEKFGKKRIEQCKKNHDRDVVEDKELTHDRWLLEKAEWEGCGPEEEGKEDDDFMDLEP